jgi:hypothetical protein
MTVLTIISIIIFTFIVNFVYFETLKNLKENDIMLDLDIELHNVNEDILDLHISPFHSFNKTSVGQILEIHDISEIYRNANIILV